MVTSTTSWSKSSKDTFVFSKIAACEFVAQRDQMTRWADRKGPEGLEEYKTQHNAESLDGLPSGLR